MSVRRAAGRSVALARFALSTNLRSWMVRSGVVAGTAVVLLGPVISLRHGRGWTLDGELGVLGVFMIAVFVIRSGLETHRETDLETYLRHDFLTVGERAGGYLLSLVGSWVVVGALAFVLVIAGGEPPRDAVWLAAVWSLRLLIVLGFVPIVEALMSLRLPLFLPVILYAGFVIVASYALPPEQADRLLIPVSPGEYEPLARLAMQAAGAFVVAALAFVAVLALQATLPRMLNIVRSRHGGAP